MISRVGRVALKLRLADHDRELADETRRTLERDVIQRVLDELEHALHARYGATTIVRVRRLAIRWQLDHDTYADPAIALELGRDLATAVIAEVEALARPQRLRPPAEANVVVFADESHAVAAELADRAVGITAWFHATASPPAEVWRQVLARGPVYVAAVEQWLVRMECRREVAAWIDGGEVPISVQDRAVALSREHVADGVAEPVSGDDGSPGVRDRIPQTTSDVPAPPTDATSLEPGAAELESAIATELAGLWYLARLVMELDLAEQLWQAGVVEGDFLALVALAIAGPGAEVDPGWRWFGGSIDHVPQLEPLQAWACAELDTARDAALARIAPGVTPLAATAFPGVDGLVARAAAALCTVFCARLGCEPDLDRVRAAVAIRGRLVLGDPLRVVMAMDAIDIEIRRVGLDLDPGYLPWLRHKVVLVFEEPNH